MKDGLENIVGRRHMRAFEALPEAARLAFVRGAGAVPAECGPEIPVAPARGAVQAFDFAMAYRAADGRLQSMPAGFARRKTLRRADVFDRMAAQSQRRSKAGKDAPGLLTATQVAMARHYRDAVEDHEAGGMRCSSVEAMPSGSGGTREGFTDHRLALSRKLDAWHAAVGPGCALAIRRVRPSERGPGPTRRVNIPDLVLLQLIAVQDMDASAVLRRHGWSASTANIGRIMGALGAALDRMIGRPLRRRSQVWVAGPNEGT